jgi:hypothetical protein
MRHDQGFCFCITWIRVLLGRARGGMMGDGDQSGRWWGWTGPLLSCISVEYWGNSGEYVSRVGGPKEVSCLCHLSRATRLRWRASIALPSAPNLRPVLTATARDWSLFWVSAWVISLSGPCSNESVQTAEAKYHAILLFRPYICEFTS